MSNYTRMPTPPAETAARGQPRRLRGIVDPHRLGREAGKGTLSGAYSWLRNPLIRNGWKRQKGYAKIRGMRLVGYARVSTHDQDLALQHDALTAVGCETVHDDHGLSGKAADRPGLAAALADCAAGDVLVARKLDRLGPPHRRARQPGPGPAPRRGGPEGG